MRDFNFFSVYSEKTNSLLSRALLIFVCVTLVGTLIGGSYFLLYLNLEGVNAQIDEIDEFLNSRTILERRVELNGLKSRLGLINQYISLTDAIRANLDKSDYFRVSVLAALAGALPGGRRCPACRARPRRCIFPSRWTVWTLRPNCCTLWRAGLL